MKLFFKKIILHNFKLIFLMLVISGCNRYIYWTKSLFTQADKACINLSIIKKHISKINCYDQLTTIGLFDILWAAPELAPVYEKLLYFYYNNKCKDMLNSLENFNNITENYISFYILTPLEVNFPDWNLTLILNGKHYCPAKIENLDKFEAPLQEMFGLSYNHYRDKYIALFDVELPKNISKILLRISSIKYKIDFYWLLSKEGRCLYASKNCDWRRS